MNYLFLLLLVLLAGCARPSHNHASGAPGDAVFNQLAEDYLAGYLAARPQLGTSLGFHQYDGKLSNLSKASLDAELARLKSFEQKLMALDTAAFSPQASKDYRLLLGSIRREIFSFDDAHIYSQNPMTYAGMLDVNIYIKRDFAPLEERVRSITAILNEAPKITAAAKGNLEDSLPRPMIETAIEEASGSADFLGKDLIDALKQVKNEQLMGDFNAADQRAIQEMRDYSAWLKQEKLPKANDHFALGREKYMKLLQYGEMLTQSPEQILEIGMQELHRKQEVFAEAAHEVDPAKPAIEVFKAIQNEHPTEQSLIPDTARDLETIRQFVVEQRLITVPSPVRAAVKETPEFLRATSFASMDTPGPFETKATEAYYYVTPPEPTWAPKQKEEWLTAFNYYTTDVVSTHEAYPGHYVQFLCLNASKANKLEKIFNSYAFVEGWAHYGEQMMVDEGFGGPKTHFSNPALQDPKTTVKFRLAQTDEALLRVCRLCASIKMHCQGMTVDEATRFFQDNCYYEEKTAHSEATRGTFDPEYLYYTVGKLEILKLREDYRKQVGSKFSLEQFHNELLRHGAPPIRLLREIMLKDKTSWDEVL